MPAENGRPPSFALPEPWHEPVDGAALFVALVAALSKYVALPDGAAIAIAAWILHAYALDAFQVTPLLQVTSAAKGCGKSTLLTVLSFLVPKPLMLSNISPASVYRVTERHQPTLLMDEADSDLALNAVMRNILNAAHFRSGAIVMRCEGNGFEPRTYSVWAPKVVAGIGRLPDTVEDRAIRIELRRMMRDERPPLRIDRIEEEFLELRRKITRWAADNLDALRASDPIIPDPLNSRQADNWRPLFAVAD